MPLDHLISWAMQGGPAPVELTDASVERITLASEHLRMAGRSGAVYGLTTGVGALRTVPTDITPSDGTSPALRLWRSHATGFGPTYDDATARAAMAIRLHQITSGRSGVSAGLAASLGGYPAAFWLGSACALGAGWVATRALGRARAAAGVTAP